ncbi:MAG: ABC transporter transmembrane domain-containing protein [Oscillospiraceae bacterium]|nr:ABC transporter transmembrane domain-containing protein [Oscillospiraceae bacterium]
MKLMYDMPEKDAAVFARESAGQKLLYCVPFNIYEEKYMTGYLAITRAYIYKILNGKLISVYPLSGASGFATEQMYGSCGFYGRISGSTTLICRFIGGRHLPRYQVIARACEILAEAPSDNAITNSSEERFCPKCGRPYVNNTKICPFCLNKKEVYMKLWALTKGLRFMIFSPFMFSFVTLAISFISPYLQRVAVDKYFQPQNPNYIMDADTTRGFIGLVALIVSIAFLSRAISVLQSRLLAVAAGKFSVVMKTLLYEKISKLSLGSINKKSTGDLMGRVSNDTDVVESFIINQFPNIFIQIVSLAGAAALLLFINWVMALFIIIPIPFVMFIVTKFWSFIQRRNMKAWMAGSRQNRLLQDILNGIRVVKSFGQEKKEIEHFKEANVVYTKLSIENQKYWDTLFPILSFIVGIGRYLILFYGSFMVLGNQMLFGELQQFNSMAAYVYSPLIWITNIPRTVSNFLTSAGKIFEILEENIEISDIGLPLDIKIEGDISIDDVTFGYESYDPVLEHINFDIRRGEMIGIVGHSGCGKTTLINLIMRLYDVNEGTIKIDSVNIKDISQHALRSQIGVVLQETFLFTGTIRENIKYASPFATDEEVIEAAKIANAHDFIVCLPEGYNTMVGEKGYSMSGGERQRIAIARAILHDPRILILDEATASLDTETEKLIQDALAKLSKNRTTLAIAHRLSTLRNADRLLVLDKGHVAEFGTHEELIAKKGIYYKLVMAQRQMAKSLAKTGRAG